LEEKFGDLPPNAVVFVTSPTYEGFTANIAEIAEKVHAGGGLLVVDEAHGAHFAFHEYCPKSALSQGADIVISSLHKTLPTMSGMAVLHVKKGAKVDIPRLKFFVNAMHTTSPSYFMMAQCGFALGKLWENPAIFDEYVSKLKKLRELLNPIPTDDPTKLLFRTDISAEKVAKILAEDYKIQAEMARGQDLLFMTSVADTDEGFERLVGAVRGIEKHLVPTEKYVPPACFSALPEIAVSPREAMLAQHETVPAEQAVGRISAELVVEYPPGIPLLVPGERVTAEHHLRQKTLGVIVEKKSALGL
jgi:lysine decarboxylase